jgi:hypothetical protein
MTSMKSIDKSSKETELEAGLICLCADNIRELI